MLQVGIRELKARLSHYLRRVREGEEVVITDRGKPVGRLLPFVETEDLEARIQELCLTGRIAWSGKRPGPRKPVARMRGPGVGVSDTIVEDRG